MFHLLCLVVWVYLSLFFRLRLLFSFFWPHDLTFIYCCIHFFHGIPISTWKCLIHYFSATSTPWLFRASVHFHFCLEFVETNFTGDSDYFSLIPCIVHSEFSSFIVLFFIFCLIFFQSHIDRFPWFSNHICMISSLVIFPNRCCSISACSSIVFGACEYTRDLQKFSKDIPHSSHFVFCSMLIISHYMYIYVSINVYKVKKTNPS